MRVYVVRKWPLRGISRFVCCNITRVSLWLLCNVDFVQSTQRTRLQTRPFVCCINSLLKLGVCASRKLPCWQVRGKNLNITSMCAVSPVVHTSKISSCQKNLFQFSCGCEQFHYGRSFGFLVINVCNHGKHYETPCILHVFPLPGCYAAKIGSYWPTFRLSRNVGKNYKSRSCNVPEE